MTFIRLHQKGNPVLICTTAIKIISKSIKGGGSFIVTDLDGQDLSVDESIEEIEALIQSNTEIEVDLFSNDP